MTLAKSFPAVTLKMRIECGRKPLEGIWDGLVENLRGEVEKWEQDM